jgi:hypothetical protein
MECVETRYKTFVESIGKKSMDTANEVIGLLGSKIFHAPSIYVLKCYYINIQC